MKGRPISGEEFDRMPAKISGAMGDTAAADAVFWDGYDRSADRGAIPRSDLTRCEVPGDSKHLRGAEAAKAVLDVRQDCLFQRPVTALRNPA